MKHISLFVLLTFVSFVSISQISRQEYISRWQLLAIEEMNRSGIPASITMAQGLLESGNGNSELSQKSNNHFGIKCKKTGQAKRYITTTMQKMNVLENTEPLKIRMQTTLTFLMSNLRYGSLFELKHTDYKGWAKGLKKAGYATAKDYDRHLIKIIEDNKLYRLDKKMSFDEIAIFEQKTVSNGSTSSSLTLSHYQAHKVVKFNGVKSIVTRNGDTYEMLAQELGLNDWELYKFNDQRPGYRPIANEIVYIHAKKSKSSKDKLSHKVQQGESMHYISQMYGIKLKSLYKLNRMKAGQQPRAGTTINLRKKKK